MTMYRANGTQIDKTTAATLVAAVPVTDPLVKVAEHLYEGARPDGTDYPPAIRKLKFREGEVIRTSQLNACFPAPVIDSITPATGPSIGGTVITVRGGGFTPGSTVEVGGVAATDVTVEDETTIMCTTPAGTVGAANVEVTNDAASVTETGGFTYV